jgi:hypothetical protein
MWGCHGERDRHHQGVTIEPSPEDLWSNAPYGPVEERVHVLRDVARDHELRNTGVSPTLVRVLVEDIDMRLEYARRSVSS